ncbi:MAG: hypothetical protein WA657_23155 [Candidatus Acidiferrales bacterium]
MNKSVINKIPVSRSFQAVSCKGTSNECPNPKWHFHGCAREVFSYLELIRSKNNHGGFLFMRVADIVAHTKDYGHGRRPYSIQQVKRVLAVFQQLGIIGKYETRTINGHPKKGWQMASHFFWAEVKGGVCDFKHWPDYEPRQRELTSDEQNETDNETDNETADETDLADNETADETAQSLIISVM